MIAAVVLASGFSSRMGRSKLSLELGGRTFLQRAIDAASKARGVGRCLVVVRPEDEFQVPDAFRGPTSEFRAAPTNPGPRNLETSMNSEPSPRSEQGTRNSELILNRHAAEGQSASIRLAAERLAADPGCEAAVFAVVDQPFLTPEVFERLVAAWRDGEGEILVSTFDGQRGNPVLFARRFFPELCQITGDVGGRDVIRRHPEAVREAAMPDPTAGQDVDTWEEFLDAQRRVGRLD